MVQVTISHRGMRRTVTEAEWQATLDDMVKTLGPWDPATSSVSRKDVPDAQPEPVAQPVSTGCVRCDGTGKLYSPTTKSDSVDCPKCSQPVAVVEPVKAGEVDDAARERIEATKSALAAAGVDMSTAKHGEGGEQFYADGTRMMDVGYSTQATRAREHASKMPVADAARELVDAIRSERRKDVEMTGADFGRLLSINGKLSVDGLTVREQALRGLLGRFKSPALSYVLGLRERIAEAAHVVHEPATDADVRAALQAFMARDKDALLDVLRRECARFCDVKLKLRTRDGLGDVFAVVSPGYAPADAPDVLGDVLAALPSDARGTFSYDPVSTAWELRASVFTPTPVDVQAVGEPFEGYISGFSRDNGTHGLDFGGGINILRCLNATTYTAASRNVRRRHVGRILTELSTMAQDASRAIHALCTAWGTARADVLAQPVDDKGGLIPLEIAIPGFYRAMLTSRKGELLGVLPGRTETHVKALALAYNGERRDASRIVRADLAQGFTRYIQTQPTDARREAERAIGQWMVTGEPVSYVAA